MDNLGLVRLLITDTGPAADQLFTDEQINAFLAMHDENVNLAAAKALLVIAASEVLVSKKIRTQDLSTDGPAVSAELRNLAASLRYEGSLEGSFFEVVHNSDPHAEAAEWGIL